MSYEDYYKGYKAGRHDREELEAKNGKGSEDDFKEDLRADDMSDDFYNDGWGPAGKPDPDPVDDREYKSDKNWRKRMPGTPDTGPFCKKIRQSDFVESPSIVDPQSAYQNGLLDALNDRENLSYVLIVAEQLLFNDRYCEGYAAGSNLVNSSTQ